MSGQHRANMRPSYPSDSYVGTSSHSSQHAGPAQTQSPHTTSPHHFDILEWHPAYLSCQKYFLDHSQHEPGTQALCALINIRLPFQWRMNPMFSSTIRSNPNDQPGSSSSTSNPWARAATSPTNRNGPQTNDTLAFVSLIPYIRRLVVTGFDKNGILHGLFGDAYQAGVGPLQDCERRNYLFAAKSGGWRSCKKQYDLNDEETVPFMKPLENVRPEEMDAADKNWGSWLEMEDWMIGPRAPQDEGQDHNRNMQGGVTFQNDLADGYSHHFGR